MKWVFIVKQNRIRVAYGESLYKELAIIEGCHYFLMYADEDYSKMTLEIKCIKEKKDDND